MNNYQNQNWNDQQNNQDNQTQEQVNSNPQSQPNNQTSPFSGLLMKMAGSCLPMLIEHFMGQQMPSPVNSNPETQLVLSQVIALQQQIITNQTALNQRLVQLETNANNQLTNLTQQVQSIKSIRLSHERKQIEFNSQQEQE